MQLLAKLNNNKCRVGIVKKKLGEVVTVFLTDPIGELILVNILGFYSTVKAQDEMLRTYIFYLMFTTAVAVCTTVQGEHDVSIFDFTNLYRSQNACRIVQRNGSTLLTGKHQGVATPRNPAILLDRDDILKRRYSVRRPGLSTVQISVLPGYFCLAHARNGNSHCHFKNFSATLLKQDFRFWTRVPIAKLKCKVL